jgi:putative endonuclease
MRPRWYYVYIMQSSSRRALYIGVCSNLERRVFQHQNEVHEGFTSKYQAWRLVYFERFGDIRSAIDREKQLKGWRRDKKIALIGNANPKWNDLSANWFLKHQYQQSADDTAE